jgi:hypothetical protein
MAQSVLSPHVSWKDVNKVLLESYNFEASIDSTALDILALYLKGQKIIYTESKTLCEKRLNTLMLPAIFIAAMCSILSLILKEYQHGTIIISCLNAFNSFLLSLISYLKLDAKAEAHKTSAYKFQKLESRCEFNSGKSLFFKNSVAISDFVNQIEKDVAEIRESNQFIIPERIRVMYPRMCEANVFTMVKAIQNDEIIVVNNLKTVVQKLHQQNAHMEDMEINIQHMNKNIQSYEDTLIHLDRDLRNLHGEIYIEDNKDDTDDKDDKDKKVKQYVELGQEKERIVSSLNESRLQLVDMTDVLRKSRAIYDQLEKDKNVEFTRVVQHRERYLKIGDEINNEIDRHCSVRRTF